MKRIYLLFLFGIAFLPLMAQFNLVYQGTVTVNGTTVPVPYHLVRIHAGSSLGAIYDSTYTDVNGHYYDTIHFSPSYADTGVATLFVEDCQNYWNSYTSSFGPNSYFIQHDFHICYNVTDSCYANFSHQETTPLTVYFYDLSTGGGNLRNWNFGDGTTSTSINPVHVYTQPGFYYVSLTIGSQTIGCTNFTTQQIYVSDSTNTGCQAAFIANPDQTTPQTIHFQDQSSASSNIVSWSWVFGDPNSGSTNTSTLQNPIHSFYPGVFQVCLTITTSNGCSSSHCQSVIVYQNSACHADFTTMSDSLNPNKVYFLDMSTGNTIQTWTWDFGDGTNWTVTYPASPNVTHTYAGNATTHNVCLTIFGTDSCFSTKCETIYTGANTFCNAEFTYSMNIPSNTPIQFTDLSSTGGGNISQWQWSFGDGTGSSLQNPSHLYAAPGTYSVCLTISGDSCQDTECKYIIIGDSLNCNTWFFYTHQSSQCFFHGYLNNSQTGTFVWDFGDGTIGNGANESHTYSATGIYSVTLTATNGNTCSATYTSTIFAGDSTLLMPVYGQVFAGNMPLISGMALIFSADTMPNYSPYVSMSPIDSLGTYSFSMVPPGNYYVYALPFLPQGFVPTYYGDKLFWEDATLISTAQLNNPYNIHLIASDSLFSGTGGINGILNVNGLKTTMVDKVIMLLMNSEGKTISYGTVNTSGNFDFTSLAYGTYFLKAEIAGVTSDLLQINLSADHPQANITMTFTGNHILGINDTKSSLTAGIVYPNPVRGTANVQVTVPSETTLRLAIYDLTGQAAISRDLHISAGTTTISIPVTGLTSGLYNLIITSDDGFRLNRKMLVTQ